MDHASNGAPPAAFPILLVEDDEVDVLAVRRSLKKLGLSNELVVAHDGIAALATLRGSQDLAPFPQPCIVLLDWNLPRMKGREFLAELRNDPALGSTVVFVMTTSDTEDDRRCAFHYNVAGYVVKGRTSTANAEALRILSDYWSALDLPAAGGIDAAP